MPNYNYAVVLVDVNGNPLSGSGGGPATIANGADVAEGSTTDVAVAGDNAGTLSAKLRGLNKTMGSFTDATVTGDVDASVTARIRGLLAIINNVWDISSTSFRTRSEAQVDYDTSGATQLLSLHGIALPSASGAVAGGTSTNPLRTDPTGTTPQPVSASALPLPTGAATESTLGGILTTSDFDTKIGSLTETAPATDTASSGLNGRLQRIAQRLTSLNALHPAALTGSGNFKVALVESTASQAITAASLPLPTGAATETTLGGVLTTSDFDTKTGSLTETAPATDTASSGLNGRLQRIAQRLTSLTALFPTALTGSGNLKVALAESTASQAITAASLPLPTGAATETTLAGIKTGTDKIPASPATDRTTAAAPFSTELSDGSAFYTAAKTGQFPSALVSGRLDVNVGNTATVAGAKTNNNAAPDGTNFGTLGAIANAADPSWTEGRQVALSTNLLGHLRACVNGFAAAGASAVGNPVYNGGIDGGGLIRGLLTDTGGRTIVTGGVADGTASATSTVNPILMGFVDGALAMRIPRTWPANSDGLVTGNNSLLVVSEQHIFDETNYVRQRGNTDQTVLTSAVRTTTQTVTFTNYNSLYLRVVLDVTAVATSSLVLTIDVQDAISGKWVNLLTGAAVSTVTTNTYVVGPGMTATANLVANNFLGRNLRVVVTPGNANNTTYSVGRQLSGT